MPTNTKTSTHLGAGMLIGAALGIAAAAFLQTKKGKELSKDLQKKIGPLQKKVMAQLKKAGTISKDRYEEIVDSIIDHYLVTKEIAQKEIPEVKKVLMSSWKGVEKQLTLLQKK